MYSTQIPIDIHCTKLVDWLVQRRHCKKDWGENLAGIRRKIKSAIKDMPESDEIKTLIVGSKLDYFKSKQIVAILKTTEADTKNLFGFYSSQRMKDWQDIVYSYEKDHIYLAEIATDLIRETNYEIPGIRRVLQRTQKEKEDADKERANLMRRNQQFITEYQKLAQTYGIKGSNVIEELQDQTKNLNVVMIELVDLSKTVAEQLNFYRDYCKSITKLDSATFLSTLQHIIMKGNTTVYEYKYGQPPESIEAQEKPTEITSEIEIMTDEIDFGDDVPSSSESSSGFVHVSGKKDSTYVDVGHSQETCDQNDKIARGDDAKLVLEFRKTRGQFLNNLYELESFLKQLICEEQSDVSTKLDKKDAETCLGTLKKMIDIFNREKTKVLFQLQDSPSFIESINEKFIAKSKQASDSLIRAEQIGEKSKNLESQIKETETHLKTSIRLTKELQSRVEESLSELYGGRQINIMGCVN